MVLHRPVELAALIGTYPRFVDAQQRGCTENRVSARKTRVRIAPSL